MNARLKRFLAALSAATFVALALRLRNHWPEFISELSWKIGSIGAVTLGWLNSNAAAVGALVAIIGLGVNIYFQFKASNK